MPSCRKTFILQKHITLMPIFCRKTSFHSKTLCSHGIIFKFQVHEKPPAFMPVFDKKNLKSVKTNLYSGLKKYLGCLFFSDFTCRHAHFDQTKRRICQNYFIFRVKKVCRITFFSDFYEQITYLKSLSTTILKTIHCSQVHTL